MKCRRVTRAEKMIKINNTFERSMKKNGKLWCRQVTKAQTLKESKCFKEYERRKGILKNADKWRESLELATGSSQGCPDAVSFTNPLSSEAGNRHTHCVM